MKGSLILACLLLGQIVFAQQDSVSVGILGDRHVNAMLFQAKTGDYWVEVDGNSFAIKPEDGLSVKLKGRVLSVSSLSKSFTAKEEVRLTPKSKVSRLKIRSTDVDVASRLYEGVLVLKPNGNEILCVNTVPLDHYVAGVVQSESGRGRAAEYYKLQSIICRTYGLRYHERHKEEGFQLCDATHCQVFKGSPTDASIQEAVKETSGQVAVDSNIEFIDATFHANCGGETVASEEVWSKEVAYLRPIIDDYCTMGKHSQWRVELSKERWMAYLENKGVEISEPKTLKVFMSHDPPCRDVYLANCEPFIPLEEVRADLGLKSTYFSIQQKGNKVILKGRGFGHGVGMCQEGAMQMARSNKDFKEILFHYFSEVHIVDISALEFFRDQEMVESSSY